jgi:hypothetical protein
LKINACPLNYCPNFQQNAGIMATVLQKNSLSTIGLSETHLVIGKSQIARVEISSGKFAVGSDKKSIELWKKNHYTLRLESRDRVKKCVSLLFEAKALSVQNFKLITPLLSHNPKGIKASIIFEFGSADDALRFKEFYLSNFPSSEVSIGYKGKNVNLVVRKTFETPELGVTAINEIFAKMKPQIADQAVQKKLAELLNSDYPADLLPEEKLESKEEEKTSYIVTSQIVQIAIAVVSLRGRGKTEEKKG